ncbi:MAG: hypothetical protein Q7T80_13300 [Methanoregula sp.]|nr:hypothetical protein [Methanoregula sp.]
MNAKEVFLIVTFLATGALLNFGYPLLQQAYAITVGIEFVVIAYCLVVMLVAPLRMTEVLGIGIFAGILNILSDITHVTAILRMHVPRSELLMAVFNLVSEPVGIICCFLAFSFLAVRIRFAAPFAAAFFATLVSGLTYLAMVFFSNPHLIAAQPTYPEVFLYRVVLAAIVNAIVVQVIFMVVEKPVKAYLAGPAE